MKTKLTAGPFDGQLLDIDPNGPDIIIENVGYDMATGQRLIVRYHVYDVKGQHQGSYATREEAWAGLKKNAKGDKG